VLNRLGAQRAAQAAGMSVRQVIRVLKAGRRPPPRNARALTRVALAQLDAQAINDRFGS
jgi:hypothetical protein